MKHPRSEMYHVERSDDTYSGLCDHRLSPKLQQLLE